MSVVYEKQRANFFKWFVLIVLIALPIVLSVVLFIMASFAGKVWLFLEQDTIISDINQTWPLMHYLFEKRMTEPLELISRADLPAEKTVFNLISRASRNRDLCHNRH